MSPHTPQPNEAVARAVRERSEQERKTAGVSETSCSILARSNVC